MTRRRAASRAACISGLEPEYWPRRTEFASASALSSCRLLFLTAGVPYAVDKGAASAVVAEAVRMFVAGSVPDAGSATASEIDAVVRVCLLGVHRSGDEDLRAMIRTVSDGLLEHLVKNIRKARENRAMALAAQFFLIEWCYRNGHLHEDWAWEWAGPNEGHIRYNPKVPLETIAIPSS